MLIRNPISIIGNFKALSKPPLFAAEWGAISVEDQTRRRAVTGALLGPNPRLFREPHSEGDDRLERHPAEAE